MAAQEARKRPIRERLLGWLEGAWVLAGSTRAHVGSSGCAVGVLGLGISAVVVCALLDNLRYFGWEAAYLYRLPLAVLLPLVPFVICWRHPSLSRLMLTIVVCAATGVFIMMMILMGLFAGGF